MFQFLLVAAVTLLAAEFAAAQTPPAPAQPQGGGDSAVLAKQLSNPVANLVSVPFQMNWDYGTGIEGYQPRFLLNFQPVMPFSINPRWNLIARLIVPVLSQPVLVPGEDAAFGMSDFLASAFFSPAQPKKFIWGVGPALNLPTTSDPFLGSGKWSIGPTCLILKQKGGWTYGALVNHLWTFAGDNTRADVDQTYLQPFLAYGTKSAITYTVSSESTANWKADSGQKWTVPIILQFSKLVRLGRRPVSLAIGYGYYVEQPDAGPDWKLRMGITLLFPK